MSNDHEILADRLNAEPAIFKGCSSSELGMIVGLAIVIWLPLSLLLAWLLGAITMGLVLPVSVWWPLWSLWRRCFSVSNAAGLKAITSNGCVSVCRRWGCIARPGYYAAVPGI